jgi:colanic acid/amylovoran biosynthesis protein
MVGFTVKGFNIPNIDGAYTKVLVDIIEYLALEKHKKIIIIPHVTIDNDIDKAQEIYNALTHNTKKNVVIETHEYELFEILEQYKNINFLIGTRLHSTIFALTTGTRAINISYHGTKPIGVFSRMGLSNYVISGNKITFQNLKKIIDNIEEKPYNDLDIMIKKIQNMNIELAKKILSI